MPLTPYHARKLVRSIAYRRKLVEDLPQMEAELTAYILANDLKYVDGYEVAINNGYLELRKLEKEDYDQLRLEFLNKL